MSRAALCCSASNTMMLTLIATDALRQSAAHSCMHHDRGASPSAIIEMRPQGAIVFTNTRPP
ncbi:MAG: hypothetical protein K1V76_06605, partial [Candidatus Amulumruptor sp.]